MKKLFFYAGVILLILNSLLGLILTAYHPFNWIVNNGIILINIALFNSMALFTIKDGFKFGLTLLFFLAGSVELLLGLFMKSHITDNFLLILLFLVLIIQFGALISVRIFNNFT